MAFGFIGSIAHGVIDVLHRAFHWQPALFFGFWILLGLAVWYPLGAKNALGIVTTSAGAAVTAWRTGKSQPPPDSGGV